MAVKQNMDMHGKQQYLWSPDLLSSSNSKVDISL